MRFLVLFVYIVTAFSCGIQEVEVAPANNSSDTKTTTVNTSLTTLPPLNYFAISYPENIFYQKISLIESGVDITKVLAEVKTLKEQLDLVNSIFYPARIEMEKIHYGVSVQSLTPEIIDNKRFFTTKYDPVDGYQSKLSMEGADAGLITWLLQSRLRTDDSYKVFWGGRMDFSNPLSIVGVYVFKYRHPDAFTTSPLDVTYRFIVADSAVPEATDVTLNSLTIDAAEASENPALRLISNDNTNAATSPTGEIHKVMVSSVEGQLYKKTVETGKPTTYTAVSVKWSLTRNMTLNSGVLVMNKQTLQMGVATNMITPTALDKAYRITWNSDGSGKFERFSSDITALTAGQEMPNATTTTCWNVILQQSSCDANVELPSLN